MAFAGPDWDVSVVPAAAREVLSRFDDRASRYETRVIRQRVPQFGAPAGGVAAWPRREIRCFDLFREIIPLLLRKNSSVPRPGNFCAMLWLYVTFPGA